MEAFSFFSQLQSESEFRYFAAKQDLLFVNACKQKDTKKFKELVRPLREKGDYLN